MNKPLTVAFSLLLACVFALLAMPASAADPPLTPYRLSVPLPGGPATITGGPAQYVSVLYLFALGAGALLAMTMIVFGAIEYTVSAGNAGRQGEARDRITNAVYGLTLLLSAYLILYLINPRLVSLSNPTLPPTPPPAALTIPFPPSNLQVLAVQLPGYDYKLIWRDNADNEEGFEVYATTNPAVPGGTPDMELLFRYAARAGTGLVPSSTRPGDIPLPGWARSRIISVFVSAYNAAGPSPISNIVTLPQIPRPVLATPTNLRGRIVFASPPFVFFEWTDNSNNPNEESFCLSGRTARSPNLVFITCVPSNSRSLTMPLSQFNVSSNPQEWLTEVFVRAQNDHVTPFFSDWSNGARIR